MGAGVMTYPGGDFAIVLADCTGEERGHVTMCEFMADLGELVARYDFKPRTWGERHKIRALMAEEQGRLDREDAAAMLAEFRLERDRREAAEDVAS